MNSATAIIIGAIVLLIFKGGGLSTLLAPLQNLVTGVTNPPQGQISVGTAPNPSSAGLGLVGGVTASGLAGQIPVAGNGLQSILQTLSQHHQMAVANEAATLNQAVPATIQQYLRVLRAAIQKEITSTGQASGLVDQIVEDYYRMVSSIIHGRWPFATNGVYNSKKPAVCNGACEVGHYWIEDFAIRTKQAVNALLAGKHGSLNFVGIPSHAGFDGTPPISMTY